MFIIILILFTILISSVSAHDTDSGPVAIVLSGGGARGAYQVGVWKGLRDLGIEIGAVYGVSVGAINGALMVMNEFDTAMELWMKLEKSNVMNISEASERVISGDFSLKDLSTAVVNLYEGGGINVRPLEELLNQYIDEAVIRSSGKDFGLLTYSLTDFSEKSLNLDDIPDGRFVDYILASANFPVFQRKVIDGQEFIDGGVYRNMAVDMIDCNKYSRAVLVSLDMNMPQDIIDYLSGYSDYDLEIVYISPRFDPGSLLDFNPENSIRMMKMGYLDCLRAYGELKGDRYYIYGDDPVRGLFLSLDAEGRQTAADLLEVENLPGLAYFEYDVSWNRFIMPEILKKADSTIELIEELALSQGVEELELYSSGQLLAVMVDKYISKSHNTTNYNRYLDFMSYLSLESAYKLAPDLFSQDLLSKNSFGPGLYLKSFSDFNEEW